MPSSRPILPPACLSSFTMITCLPLQWLPVFLTMDSYNGFLSSIRCTLTMVTCLPCSSIFPPSPPFDGFGISCRCDDYWLFSGWLRLIVHFGAMISAINYGLFCQLRVDAIHASALRAAVYTLSIIRHIHAGVLLPLSIAFGSNGVSDTNQACGCLWWGERRHASPLCRPAASDATAFLNARAAYSVYARRIHAPSSLSGFSKYRTAPASKSPFPRKISFSPLYFAEIRPLHLQKSKIFRNFVGVILCNTNKPPSVCYQTRKYVRC